MRKSTQIMAFFSFCFYILPLSAIEIKIPITTNISERDTYKIDLLKLILSKVHGYHTITFVTNFPRTQSRIIHELETNSGVINLYWMGTSKELEKKLLPVRIPVYRGIIGNRVFIIHKNHQKRFNDVSSLEDLQKFVGIQGMGWADIEILERSGLSQFSATYDAIFKIIDMGERVDYFSRGIGEILEEVKAKRKEFPNLAVEKRILLVYPFAIFFFTSYENRELSSLIEQGFKKAYDDGSFLEFFQNNPVIQHMLKEIKLENRLRIEIPNPFMSPETLAVPDKYWLKY